jgi:hypothetical protein
MTKKITKNLVIPPSSGKALRRWILVNDRIFKEKYL